MFGEYKTQLTQNISLHFLNIEEYSPDLISYIEENIHYIWNGDNEIIESDDDIPITKKELLIFIQSKSPEQKIGIIAEFICHLYIRSKSFKQHFLFRNLEEKGMKKGFDGLYLKDNEFHIFESKSSLETTTSATHNANIGEAYNDVKKRIEGKSTSNDPWRNAYNHSNNRKIDYNDTISKTLKILSQDYVKGNFSLIDNFNIMPSSTIYLGSRFDIINNEDLISKLKPLISSYVFKKIDVICVNKKSIDNFINYLNA